MSSVTGTIRTTPWRVVWEMSAQEARELAQWMRAELPADDLAQDDADALEAAADEIDPPDQRGEQ